MPKQIIWSPASESDMEEILIYLQEKWNLRVVARFINKVDDSIALISEDPKLFPLMNKGLQVRKCVITKQNTLFYRVVGNKVEILRIFDSRQDPRKLTFIK